MTVRHLTLSKGERAETDIAIAIRAQIIQIEREQSGIGTIIVIAAAHGHARY